MQIPEFLTHGVEETAFREFMLRRTLPVFGMHQGRDVMLGTGSLFICNDQHFLVTAAHVLEGVDRATLALPSGRRNAQVVTLGNINVFIAKALIGAELDVAVIQLQSPETIARMTKEWVFMSMRDLISPSRATGTHLISGFPEQYNQPRGDDIISEQVLFVTQCIPVPTDALQPIDPHVDLFLDLQPKAVELKSGAGGEVPRLQGVSGACVWAVLPHQDGSVWALENQLKVVGIQSAAAHKRYIRAKSADVLAAVLRKAAG